MMQNEPIIVALEKQVECYRRLVKLAKLQHEHVQQSQMEELLDVLGKRQEMLDQIKVLENFMGPARRDWPAHLSQMDEPDRIRGEELLAETRRLLEEIVSADRNDALVLQQRKLNLGKAIGQATAARQTNRNYAKAAYGRSPSRMDLRS